MTIYHIRINRDEGVDLKVASSPEGVFTTVTRDGAPLFPRSAFASVDAACKRADEWARLMSRKISEIEVVEDRRDE